MASGSPPRKRVAAIASASDMPSDVKPEDLIAFTNAAAGHEGVLSNASGSLIYKPCTRAEIAFYESAAHHPPFQRLMPTFLGTLNTPSDPKDAAALAATVQADPEAAAKAVQQQQQQQENWTPSGGHAIASSTLIVLQNVAHGFSHPNVLDLKLGARLWDDAAPAAKRAKLDEVSRASTSGSLGFRVAGMKVWDPRRKLRVDDETVTLTEEGYRSYDKYYGRRFKGKEDVRRGAFKEFLSSAGNDDDGKGKMEVARRFLDSVRNMRAVLEGQESRMYSASVLLVYEGDETALRERLEQENGDAVSKPKAEAGMGAEDEGDEDEDEDEDIEDLSDEDSPRRKIHDARLIDFAHAAWTPGQGPDENALQGVRSIERILERVVADLDVDLGGEEGKTERLEVHT